MRSPILLFKRLSTQFVHLRKIFDNHTMSAQAKISAFFPLHGQKREASAKAGSDPKKPKLKEVEDKSDDENSKVPLKISESESEKAQLPTLSPEQKEMIQDKKIAAKMKLMNKKTCGLVVGMGETWFKALEPEFSKPYFEQLSKFLASERRNHTVYPPADEVFTFTNACNIEDVKVVILGQDPYHGPNQAHGLCFSVQLGVRPPPSLINMYKELQTDIENFKKPDHGHLIGWSRQGVLLLNAVLTVRAANANSHKDRGWEKFTDSVISWLNKNLSGVVFILWGSYAQKKGSCIDQKKHHVLKGLHPSPLSAHKGFFGCKHFSKCNEFLIKQNKKPIDWNSLPRN